MKQYSYLRRNEDCPYQIVDGEALIVKLLPNGDSRLLSLNDCATFIWDLADGHLTVEEISKLIAGRYQVEVDQAAADIAALADDLIERGLATAELERSPSV